MENLNELELEAATSVINTGLTKAAESLSFFMKENIRYEGMNLNVNKIDASDDFSVKCGNNIHLLITNVIGELKGICCLIFSHEEVKQLRETALPPEVVQNPELIEEMSDAIMLEVDNIISAAVITQFSNLLKNNIYGGVPELKKFSKSELQSYVGTFEKDLFIFNFKTKFSTPALNFNPEFVWLFDQSFMKSVKSFSARKALASYPVSQQ